jgi:hypothetical protein
MGFGLPPLSHYLLLSSKFDFEQARGIPSKDKLNVIFCKVEFAAVPNLILQIADCESAREVA